jgi:hypothetical protein
MKRILAAIVLLFCMGATSETLTTQTLFPTDYLTDYLDVLTTRTWTGISYAGPSRPHWCGMELGGSLIFGSDTEHLSIPVRELKRVSELALPEGRTSVTITVVIDRPYK